MWRTAICVQSLSLSVSHSYFIHTTTHGNNSSVAELLTAAAPQAQGQRERGVCPRSLTATSPQLCSARSEWALTSTSPCSAREQPGGGAARAPRHGRRCPTWPRGRAARGARPWSRPERRRRPSGAPTCSAQARRMHGIAGRGTRRLHRQPLGSRRQTARQRLACAMGAPRARRR